MKLTKSKLKQLIKEELAAMQAGEEGMPAPEDDAFTKRARQMLKKAYVDDEGRVVSSTTGKPLTGMHFRRWVDALMITQGADHKGSIGQRTAEEDLPPSLSYAQEEDDLDARLARAMAKDRKVKDRDMPLE